MACKKAVLLWKEAYTLFIIFVKQSYMHMYTYT